MGGGAAIWTTGGGAGDDGGAEGIWDFFFVPVLLPEHRAFLQ